MSLGSRLILLLVSFLLLIPFYGCTQEDPDSITVLCGSAAKPAVEKAAQVFEQETGLKVHVHYGSSGDMLSELRTDKKGDLFISGSNDYIARAERARVIDTGSEKILAYLVPVIAVQKGNPKNFTSLGDLLTPGMKVAIGNPRSVGVGLYAYEIFDTEGILEDVRDAETIVSYADNCQDLAGLLVSKTVDAVIGWDVFAAWNPDDIDIVPIEPALIPRINYIQGAVCSPSDDKTTAQLFLDYLSSPAGRAIFADLGYMISEDEARAYAPDAAIGTEYRFPDDYLPLA